MALNVGGNDGLRKSEGLLRPDDPIIRNDPDIIKLNKVTSNPDLADGVLNHLKFSGNYANTSPPLRSLQCLKLKWIEGPPTLANFDEEMHWRKLKDAIKSIFQGNSEVTFLELRKTVMRFCTSKMAGNLFKNLETELGRHISLAVESWFSSDLTLQMPYLVDKCWQDLYPKIKLILSIFITLDAYHVSLWDMAVQILLTTNLGSSKELDATVTYLLDLIKRERLGELVDTDSKELLKRLVKMFTVLGIYAARFEKPFLDQSLDFYFSEGERYMEPLDLVYMKHKAAVIFSDVKSPTDVVAYLKHVEKRLVEENSRCSVYLETTTCEPLIKIVAMGLLQRHMTGIIQKGSFIFSDCTFIEDLGRMYSLASRVDALESLKKAHSLHILETVDKIYTSKVKGSEKFSSLFKLKTYVDLASEKISFLKSETFITDINSKFRTTINQDKELSSTMIAKLFSDKLREATFFRSKKNWIEELDKVLLFFNYLQDKRSFFPDVYCLLLPYRLLSGKAARIDLEKHVLSKLTEQIGLHWMRKPHRYLEDMELSKTIINSFNSSPKTEEEEELLSGFTMSVRLLTRGDFWPKYSNCIVQLPQEMFHAQRIFLKFFQANKRKAYWHHSLGSCLLDGNFNGVTTSLIVSEFQAAVLMLFNDSDQLCFQSIKDSLKLKDQNYPRLKMDKELTEILDSLTEGENKILKKIENGNQDGQSYSVNVAFTPTRKSIKMNTAHEKKVIKYKPVAEKFRTERVTGKIMEIMKEKRSYKIGALCNKVLEEVNIRMSVVEFRKIVDKLIETGFLEWDQTNPSPKPVLLKYMP